MPADACTEKAVLAIGQVGGEYGRGNEGRGSVSTEPKQVLPDAEKRTRLHPAPHTLCVFGVTSDHLKTECFAAWTSLSARGPDDESVCHRA